MARTEIATMQAIWDCRWSQPGYRLFGVGEHLQPEKLWVCLRTGQRRSVTDEECEHCVNWELVTAKAPDAPPHRDAE